MRTHSILTLGLFIGIFTSVPSWAALQTLTCRFEEGSSPDRIRIVLSDLQTGSFLYQTPDTATDASTGSSATLKLKRAPNPEPGMATFETQSSAVQMQFTMSEEHLFKAGTDVNARLASRIPEMDLSQEQLLLCDSVLK